MKSFPLIFALLIVIFSQSLVYGLNLESLTLSTPLSNGMNSTIFSNGTLTPFWNYNINECSMCHVPPYAIENVDNEYRVFYLTNENTQKIQISNLALMFSNSEILQPIYTINNSQELETDYIKSGETIVINMTYGCQMQKILDNSLNGWDILTVTLKSGGNDIQFNYMKICTLDNLSTFDWSLIILPLAAILTVALSTRNAKSYLAQLGEQEETLKPIHALVFLIVCSTVLVVFYYLPSWTIPIATLVIGLSSFACCIFIFTLMLSKISPKFLTKEFRVRLVGMTSVVEIISFFIGLCLVISWYLSRNWVLNDILALSIVIAVLKIVNLPSLKVATILLGVAFLYDIFWTLLSTSIFGSSVMASVASAVDLPLKIEFPLLSRYPYQFCSILGVGDMVFPGFFVCFTYRFDLQRVGRMYYWVSLLGYIIGLSICIFFVAMFDVAQPALLYIVPWQLGLVSVIASFRKEFKRTWRGLIEPIEYKDSLLEVIPANSEDKSFDGKKALLS